MWGRRNRRRKYDEIVSAVLIEQTQLYKNKTFWGRIYSGSVFGDPIAMSQSVPSGAELSFSVTYKTGRRKVLKSDVRNSTGRPLIADGNGSGHKDSGNRESGRHTFAEAFTHGRKSYV